MRVEFLKPTSYRAKVYGTGEVGNINDADYNRLFKRGSVRMLQMGKVEPEKPVETPNKKVEQEKKRQSPTKRQKSLLIMRLKVLKLANFSLALFESLFLTIMPRGMV